MNIRILSLITDFQKFDFQMIFLINLLGMEHYLLEEESYKIIGRCMEVHNELGAGFSEIVYKDALEYEFRKNGIPFAREVEFKVKYKDVILPHKFYADFVIFDSVILEVKALSELSNEHFEQVINYLTVSGIELSLFINFRRPRLQYKRVIFTDRALIF